jgi:hypothetical protein
MAATGITQVQAGAGACAILSSPGGGTVMAAFDRALYLRLPGGIVALTDSSVPRGPMHVPLPVLPAVNLGQRVSVGADQVLQVGGLALASSQPGWIGARAGKHFLASAHETAGRVLATVPAPDLLADKYQVARIRTTLEHGRLRTLGRLLGGLGPGLTPAGDDVLAGVLLVADLAAAGHEERLALRSQVLSVRTNDIAAAFLSWAARGQSIEPAHDFLAAVAYRDELRAHEAVQWLVQFGASSGYALAHGIGLALRWLPSVRSI